MSFFEELKRRNVVRVGIAYVLVSWLVMQITDVMAPALHLPEWTDSLVAFLLLLGFPLALFLAWVFELTPDGLRREKDVDHPVSATRATGRKLNLLITVLAVAALGYLGWKQIARDPESAVTSAEPTTATAMDGDQSIHAKSIAVLPFMNRSAESENAAFFADGVHDELLTRLSKIDELKVISRTSVMQYRDTTKTMREIGDELAVASLLEGGVQRAGDAVRINVQLIDAVTDEHLWAESYDRKLSAEDIFDIQSEIARSIANALEATLSPAEAARLGEAPTSSLEAYDHFLMASQLRERANWQSLEQALAEAEQAMALDPAFTEAVALKASILANLVVTGAWDLDEARPELEQAVADALQQDPNNASALGAKAELLWVLGDQEGFRENISAALEEAPNNVALLISAAYGGNLSGDPEWAMEKLQRARELDPLSTRVWFNVARTSSSLGRPEDALAAYERIRNIDPSSAQGSAPMTGPLSTQGKLDEALYWLNQSLKHDHRDLDHWGWIARIYTDLGDLETASGWLNSIGPEEKRYALIMAEQARLQVERGQEEAGVALARNYLDTGIANRWGSTEIMVRILLRDAVQRGDATAALGTMASGFPGLFIEEPDIQASNVMMALDLAHLHLIQGDQPAADTLLTAAMQYLEKPYSLAGDHNLTRVTARAQALALTGKNREALAELKLLADSGWRLLWRWETELNPNFDPLKGDPEYLALVQSLRQDMSRQREDARDLETRGDVLSPSEVARR